VILVILFLKKFFLNRKDKVSVIIELSITSASFSFATSTLLNLHQHVFNILILIGEKKRFFLHVIDDVTNFVSK